MAENNHVETMWVRREHLSADLEGESVILSLSNGEYYSLNEVGSLVWQLLASPKKVTELRESLVAQYDVASEQAEADIRVLLSELQRENLIEAAVESSGS